MFICPHRATFVPLTVVPSQLSPSLVSPTVIHNHVLVPIQVPKWVRSWVPAARAL